MKEKNIIEHFVWYTADVRLRIKLELNIASSCKPYKSIPRNRKGPQEALTVGCLIGPDIVVDQISWEEALYFRLTDKHFCSSKSRAKPEKWSDKHVLENQPNSINLMKSLTCLDKADKYSLQASQ